MNHYLLVITWTILKYEVFGSSNRSERQPWFCGSLKCPAFTVVKKTSYYEERCYKNTLWVSTSFTSENPTAGLGLMYQRLYSYFQQKNKAGVRLPRTTPVLLRYSLNPNNPMQKRTEMHFYYPIENAMKTVPALNNNINERRYPEMCFYVTRFVQQEMSKQLNNFRTILKADGIEIKENYPFYLATYYKTNRGKHIEIMFRK